MQAILDEISQAQNAGFYYLAIASCLTLPDICAALESTNGRSSSNKYRAWVHRNLSENFDDLSPEDLWEFRNGVLHQGRFGNTTMRRYGRVLFFINNKTNAIDRNVVDGMLAIDANRFIFEMKFAVNRWLRANATNETVQQNMTRLVEPRHLILPALGPVNFIG